MGTENRWPEQPEVGLAPAEAKPRTFQAHRLTCRGKAGNGAEAGVGLPLLILLLLGVLLGFLPACGGGSRIDLEGDVPIIGSPFPPTILIPLRTGGDKAYIQTASPPLLGVFAFDLDWVPPPLRADFFDLAPVLAGVPDALVIEEDRDLAFVTTSGKAEGVYVFDPSGGFRYLTSYTYTGAPIVLPSEETLPDSAGSPLHSIRTVYTSGAAFLQGKVYLSSSNYLQTGFDPVCAPGTVRVAPFQADEDPPRFLVEPEPKAIFTTAFNPKEVTRPHGTYRLPGVIFTTAFNPTEVTPFEFVGKGPDGQPQPYRVLLVTNTGVLAIRNGRGAPLTNASVDVVDPDHDCVVATYPLGLAAASFSKIAIVRQEVTLDAQVHRLYRGYLGSAAYNHIYELDLTGLEDYLPGPGSEICPELLGDRLLFHKILASLDTPIFATANTQKDSPNLVQQVVAGSDGTFAYATGFNSGTLAVLELSSSVRWDPASGRLLPLPSPKVPRRVFQLTDPMPTLNESGPGPVAVRPGLPGIDFQGPDLFVVTGSPVGELRSVRTY